MLWGPRVRLLCAVIVFFPGLARVHTPAGRPAAAQYRATESRAAAAAPALHCGCPPPAKRGRSVCRLRNHSGMERGEGWNPQVTAEFARGACHRAGPAAIRSAADITRAAVLAASVAAQNLESARLSEGQPCVVTFGEYDMDVTKEKVGCLTPPPSCKLTVFSNIPNRATEGSGTCHTVARAAVISSQSYRAWHRRRQIARAGQG